MAKNRTPHAANELSVQRLTFDNLSSIPRKNHILFLSDYLHEQHSYAREYASEGLKLTSSWNHTAAPAKKTTAAEASAFLDDFLLGTPMLKARAPAPAAQTSSTTVKAIDSTCSHPKISGHHGNRKENLRGNRKRTGDERGDSDKDYLNRLQERRERKRFRKSVMKSPSKESKSAKENTCTKKNADQKDKTKLQTGFALMHGFTATNVRKSRITLEPFLRNVGVFKKGKASCALKTGKLTGKNRGGHDVCFSEAQFLQRSRAKPNQNFDFKSSSASSSSYGEVPKKKVTVKHNEKGTVFKKSKTSNKVAERSVEDSSSIDEKEACTPEENFRLYDPANSIIWDIERESYIEGSEVSCRQGTVVLSLPVLARGGRQVAIAETPVVAFADVCPGSCADVDAAFLNTSDDSLHPSQSASHVAQEQPKAKEVMKPEQLAFSKYFVPDNIDTTDADADKQQDLYEGRRSVNQYQLHREERPDRSTVQSPQGIEAHLASPTLSQMFSLVVGELPHLHDTASLPDFRGLLEDSTMDYGTLHGPNALIEPDFWSRGVSAGVAFEPGLDSMLEYPDPGFLSSHFIEYGFDFNDPPVYQGAGSCSLSNDWRDDNLHIAGHEEGCNDLVDSDRSVDLGSGNSGAFGDVTSGAASGNDVCSRIAPAAILSVSNADGSSDHDISLSIGLSSTFAQGRSLLYGLDYGNTRVSDAEAEVAKLLKQNHWLPHRL